MNNVPDLVAQRAALDAQIAAAKPHAVTQVLEFMRVMGVTIEDLQTGAGATPRPGGGKRKVKYADGQGNTWTGVGQRPRWLAHALANGADLEQFRVKG